MYDFDKIIDRRGTDNEKWDDLTGVFGSEDLLPMWVADMDFPCPVEIIDAMKKRMDHPVFGYTYPSKSLIEAIMEKTERDYCWKIEPEWILFSNGVVDGLYTSIKALSDKNDNVIIQPPVYHLFFRVIKDNLCQVNENNLLYSNGTYTIDFAGLEACFNERTSAFLFCSPHNPVGRVWKEDELEKVADICLRKKTVILSDEIHCDIVFEPHKHLVMASLDKEVEKNSITYMAASKTFNIPGLSTSVVIIPDEKLRRQYKSAQARSSNGNIFGYIATEAAFRHGESYRQQMVEYVRGNMDYFINAINTHMPVLKPVNPQATYLLWVDMKAYAGIEDNDGYPVSKAELIDREMVEKCKLAVNNGIMFGTSGAGFQRFNLACPRSYVEEAVKRLRKGLFNK